jgi:4-amino-4-deoxy-L-arabinose transferase-like glycosyltransferase
VRPVGLARARRPARLARLTTLGLAAVLLVAGALRLWGLRRVPGNPFYDAAVRSMGLSWHNFFFGALEPGGTISIDKAPVDLWLQVASTKLVGYGLFGLHLPEALAGTVAVGLLFGALRRSFGPGPALLAATALAVMPIAVLTSRSDTPDAMLGALAVGALWASLRALRSGERRWVLLAAALMGLAFNVKLTEALIPLPSLALLWWWSAPRSRAITLGSAAVVFAVVALSWVSVASLVPRAERPYPIGSQSGSIWRVVFVYNGVERLGGTGAISRQNATAGASAGPLRLWDTGHSGYGPRIGGEILAALLLAGLTLVGALRSRRRPLRMPTSERGRATAAIGLWLLTGLVLFSAMHRLQPRYLEAFTPAVAAVLGISAGALLRDRTPFGAIASACGAAAVVAATFALEPRSIGLALLAAAGALLCGLAAAALLLGRQRRPLALHAARAAGMTVALFAMPLGVSVTIARRSYDDSGGKDPTTPGLSRYLVRHRAGARYEVVSANVFDVVGIVSRDALPVLVLRDVHGPITHLHDLRAAVAAGQVRFALVTRRCTRPGPDCAAVRWILAHSTRISRRGLYRFKHGA